MAGPLGPMRSVLHYAGTPVRAVRRRLTRTPDDVSSARGRDQAVRRGHDLAYLRRGADAEKWANPTGAADPPLSPPCALLGLALSLCKLEGALSLSCKRNRVCVCVCTCGS
eukprot:6189615-Pleurochrysis_carterae.AAC.2